VSSAPASSIILAAVVLAPVATRGHEVLHQVERGRAVAVRAYFADGEALAYTPYEVYSPADPKIPFQKGRTDRSGWVAFVPEVAGRWRVRVIDDTGHGLDVEVDAAPAPAAAPTAAPGSTGALVLRPLLGLAVIAAVFAVLFVLQRRKGTTP
jgi:nickel transport protein